MLRFLSLLWTALLLLPVPAAAAAADDWQVMPEGARPHLYRHTRRHRPP